MIFYVLRLIKYVRHFPLNLKGFVIFIKQKNKLHIYCSTGWYNIALAIILAFKGFWVPRYK